MNEITKHPRPFALSIAGLDPSGGAGLLADIKTFEQIGTQGLGVCTALTFQREDYFAGMAPFSAADIMRQIAIVMEHRKLEYCKIGLAPDWETLGEVVEYLFDKEVKIILDPVMRSSSGFEVHSNAIDLLPILKKVFLITPNFDEMKALTLGEIRSSLTKDILKTTHIFLKGGHNPQRPGTDYLFTAEEATPFHPRKGNYYEKHGSGCILSAAITAYLALGENLKSACFKAKAYTAETLASNPTLLAYHS